MKLERRGNGMEKTIYSKKWSLLVIFATLIVVNLITFKWESLNSNYFSWGIFWDETVSLIVAVTVYAFIVAFRKKTFRPKERIIITVAILLTILVWPPEFFRGINYILKSSDQSNLYLIKNMICTIEIALFALSCICADRGKKRMAIIAAVGMFLCCFYFAFPSISFGLKDGFYFRYFGLSSCVLLLCPAIWLVIVALRNLPEKARYVCIALVILVYGVMTILIYNIYIWYTSYSYRGMTYYAFFGHIFLLIQLAIGLLPPSLLSQKVKKKEATKWSYLEQYKKQIMK